MDDVLILAPTRWKLREAIKVLNQTFSELRLEKHPDKTFIGRKENVLIFCDITSALKGFQSPKRR